MPWESYTACRCAKLQHMTTPSKATEALNEHWLSMCKQFHVHIGFFKIGCKGTNKKRNLFAFLKKVLIIPFLCNYLSDWNNLFTYLQ